MFLPGIPEWWAYCAAVNANEDKSYGAYFVAHVIWQQHKLLKRTAGLKLPMAKIRKAGLGRSYVATGLKSLERAGLVRIKRFAFQSPEIDLITDEKIARKLRGEIPKVPPARDHAL